MEKLYQEGQKHLFIETRSRNLYAGQGVTGMHILQDPSSQYVVIINVFTDNHDRTTEEIVQLSLDRYGVEKLVRDSKSSDQLQVNPFYHWTGSKIRCQLLLGHRAYNTAFAGDYNKRGRAQTL